MNEWVTPCATTTASLGKRIVRVLSSVSPEYYARWRTSEVERVIEQDKQRTGKKPTAKQRGKLELPYPTDLVDCLLRDTATLQKVGWSQPPGSRWVDYTVPHLDQERRTSSERRLVSSSCAEAALLSLTSDSIRGRTLPRKTAGIFIGEKLHKACVDKLAKIPNSETEISTFTGRNQQGDVLYGHQHAHFIPLCLQGDRKQIDHVLVFARHGLGPLAQRAIAGVDAIYAAGLPKTLVTLLGFGDLQRMRQEIQSIARIKQTLISGGRVYRSLTPYVASRHLRRKYRLEQNIADECIFRGLPEPMITSRHRNRGEFGLARIGEGRQPPKTEGWFLQIEFDDELDESRLPLTLGYGSHFGLGVFHSV